MASSPAHAPADDASASSASPSRAPNVASTEFKAELLAALREEMSGIFKAELRIALTQNPTQITSELRGVKTELAASLAAIRSGVGELRGTVAEIEGTLSVCTDDIVSLKTKVDSLSVKVSTLEDKCEDLESRSRRNNVRIIGLSEHNNDVTPVFVSAPLRDAFNLDKEPVVDRAHRSLNPKPRTTSSHNRTPALLR